MAKFVGHAGLAFGIFHRYVYAPLEGGPLDKGRARKLLLAKAGAAAAVAAHEVALAKQDAAGSTALRKLFAPLAALMPTLGSVAANLHSGHADAAGIHAVNATVAAVEQTGSAAGVKIAERAPAANP